MVEDENLENEEIELEEEQKNNETPQKIEVITGDGNLKISPVYEHLEVEKPRPKENRKILIPEVKDTCKNKNSRQNYPTETEEDEVQGNDDKKNTD